MNESEDSQVGHAHSSGGGLSGPVGTDGSLMHSGEATTELVLASPDPSDGEEFTPVTVSPGLGGFVATAVLAVAVLALAVSLARKVRRLNAMETVRKREEARGRGDQAARDQAARDQVAYGEHSGGVTDGEITHRGNSAEPTDPKEQSAHPKEQGPDDQQ